MWSLSICSICDSYSLNNFKDIFLNIKVDRLLDWHWHPYGGLKDSHLPRSQKICQFFPQSNIGSYATDTYVAEKTNITHSRKKNSILHNIPCTHTLNVNMMIKIRPNSLQQSDSSCTGSDSDKYWLITWVITDDEIARNFPSFNRELTDRKWPKRMKF